MNNTLLSAAAGLIMLGGLTHCAASDPASAGAAFALVPPAIAGALAAKKDSPRASAILKFAAESLNASPDPLPRIHLEGTLPHHGIYDQSNVAVADFKIMCDLAIAWRMTGDARYLDAVNAYLVAWTSVYQISLNPIDETNFDQFIVAYDLVKEALPDSTRQKVTLLLRNMAEGYAGAVVVKAGDAGNWQSHRIKLLTLSAFALGDEDLIGKAHAAFSQHLAANIRPDGSVYDFRLRDALHYVTYDLEPLTMACLAAKMHGQDWFNEGAPRSVAHAFDWLVPFVTGSQTHVEFVHSTIKFDKDRANAGIPDYIPHQWEPRASVPLLTVVAAVDPAHQQLCEQTAAATRVHPTDWVVLIFWP